MWAKRQQQKQQLLQQLEDRQRVEARGGCSGRPATACCTFGLALIVLNGVLVLNSDRKSVV